MHNETQALNTTVPTIIDTNVDNKTKRSQRKVKAEAEAKTVPPKPSSAAEKYSSGTKSEIVLKKLHAAKGVSIEQLMQATGWQAHSLRGFLSGTVKKKLGLAVISEPGKDGVRRYRIDDAAKAG